MGWLIVYKCLDNQEEESCFVEYDITKAGEYIKSAPPPDGFDNRPGFYFIEYTEDPRYVPTE